MLVDSFRVTSYLSVQANSFSFWSGNNAIKISLLALCTYITMLTYWVYTPWVREMLLLHEIFMLQIWSEIRIYLYANFVYFFYLYLYVSIYVIYIYLSIHVYVCISLCSYVCICYIPVCIHTLFIHTYIQSSPIKKKEKKSSKP